MRKRRGPKPAPDKDDWQRATFFVRKEYLKKIKIGKDGLIIEYGVLYKGLLLPQVPVQYDWDVKTYLEHLCMKAGLFVDTWLNQKVKIYKFQAQIFMEKKPNGEVIQT